MDHPYRSQELTVILDKKGISYSIQSRLLNISMPESEFTAEDLANRLRRFIRQQTSAENLKSTDYVAIHKAARMAYELTKDHRLSNLDAADVNILYDLPLSEQIEWLNKILNICRFQLASSDPNNILAADVAMKTIDWVMAS